MAWTALILARQPVQSSNQSNPIPDVLQAWAEERARRDLKGDTSCYVCYYMSHPKLLLLLHPHHRPSILFTLFSLRWSSHQSSETIFQLQMEWRNYMGQVLGCDLFVWDWIQTSLCNLSYDLTAHSSPLALSQQRTCFKTGHIPSDLIDRSDMLECIGPLSVPKENKGWIIV